MALTSSFEVGSSRANGMLPILDLSNAFLAVYVGYEGKDGKKNILKINKTFIEK